MRAGIGLVGILLGVGLLMWLYGSFSVPAVKKGNELKEKATQLSGRGADGGSVMESISLAPQKKGERLVSLRVQQLTPMGAMEQFYGLQVGDEIIEIGSQAGSEKVGELIGGNDMADETLFEAHRRSLPIVVRRNGRTLTLPVEKGATADLASQPRRDAPPAAPESQTPPAEPAEAPQSDGIGGQLDAIRNAAGGAGRDQ